MPVTIKSAMLKYKNSNGEYIGVNALAETTTASQIAAITQAGTSEVSAITQKGVETRASIPDDYTTLSDSVSDLKTALDANSEQFESVQIEGYEKNVTTITGTIYSGKAMSQSGSLNDQSGWNALEIDAVAGATYLVAAQGAPAAIVTKNVNGDVVDYYKPGSNVVITDYSYTAPPTAAKIYLNKKGTPNAKFKYGNHYVQGDDLKYNLELISETKEMQIEGYEKGYDTKSGTLHSGKMWTGTEFSDVTGWYCLEMNVKPNTNYIFSGTGNPMFSVHNAAGESTYKFKPGANTNYNNKEYTTESDAVKIYLNRRNAVPIAKEQTRFKFELIEHPTLGATDDGETYTVGNGSFVYEVGMHSSSNGGFNYNSLTYEGSAFKGVTDDIAPIQTDADYIGANHGYNFGYECTSTSHGYTESDIGKTYNDGTNTWVLLKVLSEDKFLIGCYNASVWYKMKTLNTQTETFPESVNFGSSATITAHSLAQIRPSIKNISQQIVENSKNRFKVLEIYDIIDIGTGIEAIKENVGNNDNDSLVDLSDSVFKIKTVYDFNDAGAIVLYQQVSILKENVARLAVWYGSQASRIETSGDLVAVPGTTIPTLQNSVLTVPKDNWISQDKAPSVFVKTNSGKTKGIAIAYLNDRTEDLGNSAGFVNNTNMKLYPYMVAPNSKAIGSYENIIVRFTFVKNASGADYVAYQTVGKDIYVFVGLLTAKAVEVSVDADIYGKKVEGKVLSNCTVDSEDVITGIKLTSTDEAYALLRVY